MLYQARSGRHAHSPWLPVLCISMLLAAAHPAQSRSLLSGVGPSLRQHMQKAPVQINPAHFRSQVRQDSWVLNNTGGRPGYFMDMGARDGEQISNSYALEKHGWDGVCIEPFPTNFKEAGRTCMLAREVLSNSTGDVVSFVMPDKNSIYGRGYGGIKDTISWKFIVDYNGTQFANVTTLDVRDFLVKYNVPKHIDYWSLDIEGAEYWVLKAFPFCDYYVGLLTVEHNWQEPRRTNIRDLLEHHAFVNERQVEYDDWYRNTRPPPGERSNLDGALLTTYTTRGAAGDSHDKLLTAAKYAGLAVAMGAGVGLVQQAVLARRRRKRGMA